MFHFAVHRLSYTSQGKAVWKVLDKSQKQGLTELNLNSMNISQRTQNGKINPCICNEQRNNLNTPNLFCFVKYSTSTLHLHHWIWEVMNKKGERKRKKKRRDDWMKDNKFGDEGAKAISETLQVNTTLTSLNLESEK